MNPHNQHEYFKASPEIISLAVMYYVRYPLTKGIQSWRLITGVIGRLYKLFFDLTKKMRSLGDNIHA